VRISGNATTDADLTVVNWAIGEVGREETILRVDHSERPVRLHGAVGATGAALLSNGELGIDLLRVAAGTGFAPHTHPGHHILVVVAGEGTITYGGRVFPTSAGQVYLVEGNVPHGVGAVTDHVILAIGSPHKAIDADDRMTPRPYREIVAPDGDLHCLICTATAELPTRLHDVGCPHCPCAFCAGVA
jgi:quercetin dioxygenase-like cupin family protein